MARSLTEIEQELMALSSQERVRLVRDLINSLDEDEQKLTTEEWERAWYKEVKARELEVREGRAQLYSAKETIEELKDKYNK